MDEHKLSGLIESILFVSGEAVSARRIADFLGIDIRNVRKLLENLVDIYNFEGRGLQIVRADDNFQLATRPEYGEYIDSFFGNDRKQNLSQAMLETLSIIAYRQPITRMDVEQTRGVKCEYTISSLSGKGLIKEVGKMDAPGRPILYGTTDLFLKLFGLISLNELPPLSE